MRRHVVFTIAVVNSPSIQLIVTAPKEQIGARVQFFAGAQLFHDEVVGDGLAGHGASPLRKDAPQPILAAAAGVWARAPGA
jgi:hypothetical protein